MTWLALDIGGANLKAADGRGFAASRPFALWRAPERLPEELSQLISAAPTANRLAVTMTGELADCYETKAIGVRSILHAVEAAVRLEHVAVYLTDGRLVTVDQARETPHLAAASNWRALAQFANRFAPASPALLIDLGSTTTDIIPLAKSGPCPVGITDTDRLLSGELVYTGIDRTPLSAIVRRLPWRGDQCPVATELFATAADAYLLLGEMAEGPDDSDTADGRPRTRGAAHARLARMICSDATAFSIDDAAAAASAIRDAQLVQLQTAVIRVACRLERPPQTIIISGQGEFLLRQLVARLPWKCNVVSLTERLGGEVSRCAPAHALAGLAREALGE
jgi:(4-(4-[2-(gamma-L-glutamylamino)ethyl]phenoxymethyl)furan-2-yl)methanamine synthase